MIKIIAIVTTIFMACATSKYDRALKNCNTKCYPQVAVGVDYNYNNNRYDKCVCKTEDDARKMK